MAKQWLKINKINSLKDYYSDEVLINANVTETEKGNEYDKSFLLPKNVFNGDINIETFRLFMKRFQDEGDWEFYLHRKNSK